MNHRASELFVLSASSMATTVRAAARVSPGSGTRCYSAVVGCSTCMRSISMGRSSMRRHRMARTWPRATIMVAHPRSSGLGPPVVQATLLRATSRKATAAVVPSAAILHQSVFAPAVTIAPARPRAHAKEDAVVRIA